MNQIVILFVLDKSGVIIFVSHPDLEVDTWQLSRAFGWDPVTRKQAKNSQDIPDIIVRLKNENPNPPNIHNTFRKF